MITGKTSSGFEYSVSEKLRNDFRFVLAFADMGSDDADEKIRGGVELVNVVLGREGAAALYRHVAEADGTVPTDKVMAELTEIIRLSGQSDREIKN